MVINRLNHQYSEADTPMSWFNNPESMWVVMVYPTQLRGNLKRLIQQTAKRVACISKGDSVCLKKALERSNPYRPKVMLKSGAATTYTTMTSRRPLRYSGCRSRPARTSVFQHDSRECLDLNISQVASRLQPQTAHTGEDETATSYHQWVSVLLGKTRHTPTDRFV